MKTRALAALCVAAAVVVAGCGGTSTDESGSPLDGGDDVSTTTTVEETTTTTSPAAKYFRSSSAVLQASTGDSAEVVYELGAAKSVNDLPLGVEAACIDDPVRTVAVPFRITFTVTSSLPVRIGTLFDTPSIPVMGVALNNGGEPDCYTSGQGAGAFTRGFSDVDQGETRTIKGAFLFLGAVTPNSPDGDPSVLSEGLSEPRWYLNSETRFGPGGSENPVFDGNAYVTCEGSTRQFLSIAYSGQLVPGHTCTAADGSRSGS